MSLIDDAIMNHYFAEVSSASGNVVPETSIEGPETAEYSRGFYEQIEELVEEHDFPYVTGSNEVNGTEIVHIGSPHSRDVYREFDEFFSECLEASDAVMTENPVGDHFFEKNGLPHFFHLLGREAAEQDMIVYETDPHTEETRQFDKLLLGAGLYQIAKESYNTVFSEPDPEKMALGGLLAYSSKYGQALRPLAEIELINEIETSDIAKENSKLSKYGLGDKLNIGVTDWRNVTMADNIEKITEQEEIDRLLTVEGVMHTDKIEGYLEDEELRNAKKAIYSPLNHLVADQIKPRKFENRGFMIWDKEVIE